MIRLLSLAAASAAVLFACGRRETAAPTVYMISQGPACVGEVRRFADQEREDADGSFLLSRCELTLRRWEDGAGVVTDELRLLAARRPGGPVYYASGEWGRGSFRYRTGRASWRLAVRDEFGNAAETRGPGTPTLLTFRGIALPLPAAAGPPGSRATFVELADGRAESVWGHASRREWTGRRRLESIWFAYDDDGAPIVFRGADGLALRPGSGRGRPAGFVHSPAKLVFLPLVFRPGPGGARVRIPLTARLSAPTDAAALAAPGQLFTGEHAAGFVTGVFAVDPAAQTPLAPARLAAFAPRAWGPWPEIEGAGALARLAAKCRAQGRDVTYCAGLGLFAGNVLAAYEWVEADGVPLAAPGRPVPQWRVTLGRGNAPASLEAFALAGKPEATGPGVSAFAAGIPALGAGAGMDYRVYKGGVAAGDFAVWYEAAPNQPPFLFYHGEVMGRTLEGVAPASLWADGEPVPLDAGAASLAAFVAVGGATATARAETAPPYEFCWPLARGVGRARWLGVKPVAVGDDVLACRVYAIEPGGFLAYYTYQGVLVRLDWARYSVRLVADPLRRPGAVAAATIGPESAAAPPAIP